MSLAGKSGWFRYAAVVCCVVFLSIGHSASGATATEAESFMNKAQAAFQSGDFPLALKWAGHAVDKAPRNAQCYWVRGRIYSAQGEHDKAIADFDQAIKIEPRGAELYQLRGCEQFKLAHIAQSIADFDKYLEFMPKRAPHHWQRGISYYYAGRYEDGRKQFELHQTVNPSDVENAVWHFLCVARLEGAQKAREALIPIKEDRRVPMMQIYDLYAAKGSAEKVFAAATTPEAQFYANLYVGLYNEATGNAKLAAEYISKAAQTSADGNYMVDVAHVHEKLLAKKK